MADEVWPPEIKPETVSFYLQPNTLLQSSPATRKRRTVRLKGTRWVCEMSIACAREKAQPLEALLDRLRGPSGTVALWDPDRIDPLGTNLDRGSIGDTRFTDLTTFTDSTIFDGGPAGIRLLSAYAVGATDIWVDGFPQSTTQLLAGDNVEIGARLYRLTADAVADSLGRAYLYLNRGLLAAAALGDLVTRTRASSPFAMVDDNQPKRASDSAGRNQFNLSFLEVL